MAKEFTIENEYLKVTVTTWGAQVKSVVRKCDHVEHIWQADKSVWGYHAPILFPYAVLFSALSFVTMCFVKHGDSKPMKKASVLENFDVED